jgi:hypothetical protein
MSKAIPLGKKLGDMIHISEISPEKDHCPDLFIESDERALAEIPDEGTAEIHYRVRSRTHKEEKRGKGKDYTCSLRLEIVSITPPENKKRKNGDSDHGARKAMDNYFKDK